MAKDPTNARIAVAGQWQRKGSEFDLVITENASAPEIPVGGKLELLS
jgi:branched-chain amino acid transport system substrate-binding protein